jgi:hypothetical protein
MATSIQLNPEQSSLQLLGSLGEYQEAIVASTAMFADTLSVLACLHAESSVYESSLKRVVLSPHSKEQTCMSADFEARPGPSDTTRRVAAELCGIDLNLRTRRLQGAAANDEE